MERNGKLLLVEEYFRGSPLDKGMRREELYQILDNKLV